MVTLKRYVCEGIRSWSDWISYKGNPVAVGDEEERKAVTPLLSVQAATVQAVGIKTWQSTGDSG